MKQVTILVLLVITAMAGTLAAEVSAPNAAVTTPVLPQNASSRLASAAWLLPTPEIWSHLPLTPTSACGPAFSVTTNYWGFEGYSGDSCPVVCGPCGPADKLVGQVIEECDGTTTQWGLICDREYTTTIRNCPFCGEEEY